jgi:predicted transposase/invertase (TIGR01784 family)
LAFLRDYLPPDVAAHLDLTHLQLVKDSFVDEALQEHFSDLVYEVALRNAGRAYICVLFEHKSYVDSLSALQVLRYMVHGWEYSLRQQARLWPVIPVVVYHGAAPWTVATNFQALFDLPDALLAYVPEFHYLLNDLSTYSDEELKRSAEVGVALLVMKHIFRPDLRARLPEVLRLWYTLQQEEHALGYLEAVLRYVVFAGKEISEDDVRQVLEEIALEQETVMGTIAQELLERGERSGLQQGLQQGLRAGCWMALNWRWNCALGWMGCDCTHAD